MLAWPAPVREMSVMRRYAWLSSFIALGAGTQPSQADVARPVRPGVMCLSAQALAILTLPNGDSRTHQPSQRERDAQVASQGGCVDLAPAMHLLVHRRYHNTSLVYVTGQDGAAAGALYRVPNIDLEITAAPPALRDQAAVPPPGPATAVAPGPVQVQPQSADLGDYVVKQRFKVGPGGTTIELLQDRRISPQVFAAVWRAGRNGLHEARASGLLSGGPLLAARLRLTSGSGQPVQTRDIGYPLATLSPLDDRGDTFSLHVDASNRREDRITEEKLVPAAHGLTPPDYPPHAVD